MDFQNDKMRKTKRNGLVSCFPIEFLSVGGLVKEQPDGRGNASRHRS